MKLKQTGGSESSPNSIMKLKQSQWIFLKKPTWFLEEQPKHIVQNFVCALNIKRKHQIPEAILFNYV